MLRGQISSTAISDHSDLGLDAGSCELLTCTTTMLPTAAAAWAARGDGASPAGVARSHFPVRTFMMCTSLVAPASRMPVPYTRSTLRMYSHSDHIPPPCSTERSLFVPAAEEVAVPPSKKLR